PLRERREDIAPLARHFASQLSRRWGRPVDLSKETLDWLKAQPWRGNVRELENAVERAAVMTEKAVLSPDDFERDAAPASGSDKTMTLDDAVERAERAAIVAALAACDG